MRREWSPFLPTRPEPGVSPTPHRSAVRKRTERACCCRLLREFRIDTGRWVGTPRRVQSSPDSESIEPRTMTCFSLLLCLSGNSGKKATGYETAGLVNWPAAGQVSPIPSRHPARAGLKSPAIFDPCRTLERQWVSGGGPPAAASRPCECQGPEAALPLGFSPSRRCGDALVAWRRGNRFDGDRRDAGAFHIELVRAARRQVDQQGSADRATIGDLCDYRSSVAQIGDPH